MIRLHRLLALVGVLATLTACISAPPAPPPAPVDTTTPAQRLALIEREAGVDDTELSVQPLRDPQVDDLRETAKAKRQIGDLAAAAAALDQALGLVSGDPAILQERAEVAVLQGDWNASSALPSRPSNWVPRPARCAAVIGRPSNRCAWRVAKKKTRPRPRRRSSGARCRA